MACASDLVQISLGWTVRGATDSYTVVSTGAVQVTSGQRYTHADTHTQRAAEYSTVLNSCWLVEKYSTMAPSTCSTNNREYHSTFLVTETVEAYPYRIV